MEIYKGIGTNHCDHEDLIDFLNYVFGMNGNDSGFYRLLPKLYRPHYRPEDYNFIVTEDGKLRGAVGAYPIALSVMGEELSAIGIGNVAVHPFHRGKGYMKDCMKLAMDDAVEKGYDFAVLGGRRQRYSYFGFELAGVCNEYWLDKTNLRHCFGSADNTTGYTAKQLTAQDTEALAAIDALVRSRLSHPVRWQGDRLYDVLNNWESRVCAVYAADGAFAGYFLAASDALREIDCCENHAQGVLRAAHEFMGCDGLKIKVPEHAGEIAALLTATAESISRVHTENYSIFHYEKVVRACLQLRCALTPVCDGEITVKIDGFAGEEKLCIKVEGGKASVEAFDGECDVTFTHKQAMNALFALVSQERAALPAAVNTWLPLPLFVPEVDND